MSEELAQRYDHMDDGSGDFKHEDAVGAKAAFVIGLLGGRTVAFRPFENHVAEIKTMFVAPLYRGRGYSKAILAELERRVWENGYCLIADRGLKNIQALNNVLAHSAVPWWDVYGGKGNIEVIE